MKRQVFVDINVTGLNAYAGDRLVEIACVEVVGSRPTGRVFHHHFNPQWPVHETQAEAHGLTASFLEEKPLFADFLSQFVDFIYDAEIFCIDLEFSKRYIDSELERERNFYLHHYAGRLIDGQTIARKKFPGWRRDLYSLSRYLNTSIAPGSLRNALDRATLFAEIYTKLTVLPTVRKPKYLQDTEWGNAMVELCRNHQVVGKVLFDFFVEEKSTVSRGGIYRFQISDEKMDSIEAKWFRSRVIETVTLMFEERLRLGKTDAVGGEIIVSEKAASISWQSKKAVDALWSS
ncbi:MAG: hypothetical protein H0W47_12445 [Polaromonas sp.]|uniref:exonuclease domain-containing protein n=1 Tax=Polaromonas sp. TaxID=1869339 RepID=UPI0017DC77A8|nr:exonuclease domain-containing protein [Polaromonas sp.]MBA3594589.1 hypothetical protein [Polaromonas sp.]